MTPDGLPPDDSAPDARTVGLVAGGLLRAVPQVDPPAHLKARVMAVTGKGARPAGEASPETLPVPPRGTATRGRGRPVRRGVPSWLPLAAAAVVALGLGLYAVELRGRLETLEAQLTETTLRLANTEADVRDARTRLVRAQAETAVLAAPDLTRVDLAGQAPAPAAVARAFWSRAHGLVLTATRLPDLPQGRTYQVWMLTDDAPVSAGLFAPDAEGRATAVFDTPVSLPEPRGVAVSIEPEGGVSAPTGDIVLAGRL